MKKVMNNIKKIILELEEKLLHSDVRKNPEVLNELLSEEFEEIGSIGKISSREEVVHWLVNKEKGIHWSLTKFRVQELAPGLVLAIYQSNKKENHSNYSSGSIRSSIWKQFDSSWKMIFHQGTKILKS